MIRTVKVELNAAYPNMPLEPVKVFNGSAASFTILNVPKAVGQRAVNSVSLIVKNPAGVTSSFAAVRVGSAFEATAPASVFGTNGKSSLGVKFVGVGKDENGNATSWVIGVADLFVLDASGSVVPGETKTDVHKEDFEDVDALENATLKETSAKVNEILAILKPAALLFAALPLFAELGPNTEFGDVPPDSKLSEVVSAGGGGGGGSMNYPAVTNIAEYAVQQYDATNLTARLNAKVDGASAANIAENAVRQYDTTNLASRISSKLAKSGGTMTGGVSFIGNSGIMFNDEAGVIPEQCTRRQMWSQALQGICSDGVWITDNIVSLIESSAVTNSGAVAAVSPVIDAKIVSPAVTNVATQVFADNAEYELLLMVDWWPIIRSGEIAWCEVGSKLYDQMKVSLFFDNSTTKSADAMLYLRSNDNISLVIETPGLVCNCVSFDSDYLSVVSNKQYIFTFTKIHAEIHAENGTNTVLVTKKELK